MNPEQAMEIMAGITGDDYEPATETQVELGDRDATGLEDEQYELSLNGIDGTAHGVSYQHR